MRPPRTGFFRLIQLALAAALLGSGAVFAAEPMRTKSGHMVPPPEDDPHFEEYRLLLLPKKPQVVMRDNKKDWRKAGKMDKALTRACRAGRFREWEPLLFRAIYSGEVLGVAFGHGLNLRDADHLAKPNLIYLFHDGGTAGCEVMTTQNLDPRAVGK